QFLLSLPALRQGLGLQSGLALLGRLWHPCHLFHLCRRSRLLLPVHLLGLVHRPDPVGPDRHRDLYLLSLLYLRFLLLLLAHLLGLGLLSLPYHLFRLCHRFRLLLPAHLLDLVPRQGLVHQLDLGLPWHPCPP